jgi:hypothetical protein
VYLCVYVAFLHLPLAFSNVVALSLFVDGFIFLSLRGRQYDVRYVRCTRSGKVKEFNYSKSSNYIDTKLDDEGIVKQEHVNSNTHEVHALSRILII